jgi:hypothetical protein
MPNLHSIKESSVLKFFIVFVSGLVNFFFPKVTRPANSGPSIRLQAVLNDVSKGQIDLARHAVTTIKRANANTEQEAHQNLFSATPITEAEAIALHAAGEITGASHDLRGTLVLFTKSAAV